MVRTISDLVTLAMRGLLRLAGAAACRRGASTSRSMQAHHGQSTILLGREAGRPRGVSIRYTRIQERLLGPSSPSNSHPRMQLPWPQRADLLFDSRTHSIWRATCYPCRVITPK